MLASIAALFLGDEPVIVAPAPTVAELLALSLLMVIIPPRMVTIQGYMIVMILPRMVTTTGPLSYWFLTHWDIFFRHTQLFTVCLGQEPVPVTQATSVLELPAHRKKFGYR